MASTTPFSIRSVEFLVLVVVAAILLVSHTPVGAALSMDSLIYLLTASNILGGNGIAYDTFSVSGPALEETTIWPPLYSIVLSVTKWIATSLEISEVNAIVCLNFLALISSLYLMLKIAALNGPRIAGAVVGIAFLVSPSIQLVFIYAWSEVLFIPFSLAAYLYLQRYLRRDSNHGVFNLVVSVIFLGLATNTRYVGLAFLGAASLTILVCERANFTARLKDLAIATMIFVGIVAPMFVRNLFATGSFSGGDRGTPALNVMADLWTMAWVVYLEFLNTPLFASVIVLTIFLGLLAWLLAFQQKNRQDVSRARLSPHIVAPFTFAFAYLAFLLAARSRQNIDLDIRMLSVCVPFLLIGVFGVYVHLSTRINSKLAALPFIPVFVAFAINAITVHNDILSGWRELGEPGELLGANHPSITGRQMDTLRGIQQVFGPGQGELVLTDIARPIIVAYLFPDSDVRQITDEPGAPNIASLDKLLHENGIAIIGNSTRSRALARILEDRADFYGVRSETGGPSYTVIELPVEDL